VKGASCRVAGGAEGCKGGAKKISIIKEGARPEKGICLLTKCFFISPVSCGLGVGQPSLSRTKEASFRGALSMGDRSFRVERKFAAREGKVSTVGNTLPRTNRYFPEWGGIGDGKKAIGESEKGGVGGITEENTHGEKRSRDAVTDGNEIPPGR